MNLLHAADFALRLDDLLGLLKQLVAIESPSTDKAAVDRLGAFVAGQLRALGAAVSVDEQTAAGNNVIGRWGAGRDGLLVLCHLLYHLHRVTFPRAVLDSLRDMRYDLFRHMEYRPASFYDKVAVGRVMTRISHN